MQAKIFTDMMVVTNYVVLRSSAEAGGPQQVCLPVSIPRGRTSALHHQITEVDQAPSYCNKSRTLLAQVILDTLAMMHSAKSSMGKQLSSISSRHQGWSLFVSHSTKIKTLLR